MHKQCGYSFDWNKRQCVGRQREQKKGESGKINEPVKLHLKLTLLKCQQQQQEEEGKSRLFPFNYNAASGSAHRLINNVFRTTPELTGCLLTSRQAGKVEESKQACAWLIPLFYFFFGGWEGLLIFCWHGANVFAICYGKTNAEECWDRGDHDFIHISNRQSGARSIRKSVSAKWRRCVSNSCFHINSVQRLLPAGNTPDRELLVCEKCFLALNLILICIWSMHQF